MPDISMCEGGECPHKEKCYRYKAKPSEYQQTFFDEVPYKNGKCEHFMKYWGEKNKPMPEKK